MSPYSTFHLRFHCLSKNPLRVSSPQRDDIVFVDCNCDIGGSESPVCDRESGQCVCKPRVEGKRCEK